MATLTRFVIIGWYAVTISEECLWHMTFSADIAHSVKLAYGQIAVLDQAWLSCIVCHCQLSLSEPLDFRLN